MGANQQTDLEYEINNRDEEEVLETLGDFLLSRQMTIQTARDDQRQIQVFFSMIQKLGAFTTIKFKNLSTLYRPATDLYTQDEIKTIGLRLRTHESYRLNALFALYAKFGLRRKEALYLKPSNIELLTTVPVVRVVGDSVFRPKFRASNRWVSSNVTLLEYERNALQSFIAQSKEVDSSYLCSWMSETEIKSTIEKLTVAIRSITFRGSIHTLRHSFADALAYDLFCVAIGMDTNTQERQRSLIRTTPGGINRKTLWIASKIMGHSGPKTLLETYSHRAFDVVDWHYVNSVQIAPDLLKTIHCAQPTLAEQYPRLREKHGHLGYTQTKVNSNAKEFLIEILSYLNNSTEGMNMSGIRPTLRLEVKASLEVMHSWPDSLKPAVISTDQSHLHISTSLLKRLTSKIPGDQSILSLLDLIRKQILNDLNPKIGDDWTVNLSSLCRMPMKQLTHCAPLGNFTDSGQYMLRKVDLKNDLIGFLHITGLLKLLGFNPSDLHYKTNSPSPNSVDDILGHLGIKPGPEKTTQTKESSGSKSQEVLPSRTVVFNADRDDRWVISVRHGKKELGMTNTTMYVMGLIIHLLNLGV